MMKTLWIFTQDLRTVPRKIKTTVSVPRFCLFYAVKVDKGLICGDSDLRPGLLRLRCCVLLLSVASLSVCFCSGKDHTLLSPNKLKESLDLYEELLTEEQEEKDATYNEV